jgi:hypothetical protein
VQRLSIEAAAAAVKCLCRVLLSILRMYPQVRSGHVILKRRTPVSEWSRGRQEPAHGPWVTHGAYVVCGSELRQIIDCFLVPRYLCA